MPPLEAVDGPQVADGPVRQPHAVEEGAAAVALPDSDAGGGEAEAGAGAGDEPEQFADDGPVVDALRG